MASASPTRRNIFPFGKARLCQSHNTLMYRQKAARRDGSGRLALKKDVLKLIFIWSLEIHKHDILQKLHSRGDLTLLQAFSSFKGGPGSAELNFFDQYQLLKEAKLNLHHI